MAAAAPRSPCAPSPASRSSSSAPAKRSTTLDDFHPGRIANRILGMGDIVALVEKAAQTIDAEKAQAIADRMRKGKFDLERSLRTARAG